MILVTYFIFHVCNWEVTYLVDEHRRQISIERSRQDSGEKRKEHLICDGVNIKDGLPSILECIVEDLKYRQFPKPEDSEEQNKGPEIKQIFCEVSNFYIATRFKIWLEKEVVILKRAQIYIVCFAVNSKMNKKCWFENGYSEKVRQTQKIFFLPPKRVLVVWSSRLRWEESKQVPPTLQCWIAHVVILW